MEDEKTPLAYEEYKMKDSCEGDEFTPSFSVGEHKITAREYKNMNYVHPFASDFSPMNFLVYT